MKSKTLADRARAYYTEHPEQVPPAPVIGPAGPRPWDRSLEEGARRIEELRKRFPRRRVERAAAILQRRYQTPEATLDDLEEQVYRAHYSSLKIRYSWQCARDAVVAIGHLIGAVPPKDADGYQDFLTAPEERGNVYRSARDAVQAQVWPFEDGLWEALDHLEVESFYGQIPLKTGLLALGARLLLHQYASVVVGVLRRLHANNAYTYELCLGRRPLDWHEAMAFKTPPNVLSQAEREHAEEKRNRPDWRKSLRESGKRLDLGAASGVPAGQDPPGNP